MLPHFDIKCHIQQSKSLAKTETEIPTEIPTATYNSNLTASTLSIVELLMLNMLQQQQQQQSQFSQVIPSALAPLSTVLAMPITSAPI
jgi:hypothetical protein